MAKKAYKFHLYPTKEQEQLLDKNFECVRFVYHKMLAERRETYGPFKDDKEIWKKIKLPTYSGSKKEFVWLKEVDSLVLINTQLNLQEVYQNFFSGSCCISKVQKPKDETVLYN
uniref:helix-turn-helix domain-containing protein n=1 Tax=Massilibacterium senegalense TaxID=1632858 RepID=UPI00093DB8EA